MTNKKQSGSLLPNCKNTKNRESIINVLKSATQPISAEDIFLKLKEQNVSISLSTVYRTLELLLSINMVSKSYPLDTNKARFELIQSTTHKHYCICTVCSKMFPIKNCPIPELEKSISDKEGFNITGHKLEIYGQCPNCKEEK